MAPEPEPGAMEVVVTAEAARYIGDRGGRLYLWQTTVGKGWAADHMGFIDPSRETPFAPVWVDGITLMLAEDLEPPQSIRIRVDRIPRRLHVEWDGQRWGWRGGALGVDGGGG